MLHAGSAREPQQRPSVLVEAVLPQPPPSDAPMNVRLQWLFRQADADCDGVLCYAETAWLLRRATGTGLERGSFRDACAVARGGNAGLLPSDLEAALTRLVGPGGAAAVFDAVAA